MLVSEFVDILRKAIEQASLQTQEDRETLYKRARNSVSSQLYALKMPKAAFDKQMKTLEKAIKKVESFYQQEDQQSIPVGPQEHSAVPPSETVSKKAKTPQGNILIKKENALPVQEGDARIAKAGGPAAAQKHNNDFIFELFSRPLLQQKAKQRKKAKRNIFLAGFAFLGGLTGAIALLWMYLGTPIKSKNKNPEMPSFTAEDSTTPKPFMQCLRKDGREEVPPPPQKRDITDKDPLFFSSSSLSSAQSLDNDSLLYYREPGAASPYKGKLRLALLEKTSVATQKNVLSLSGQAFFPETGLSLHFSLWKNDNPKINARYLMEVFYKNSKDPDLVMKTLQKVTFRTNTKSPFQEFKGVTTIKIADNLFVYAFKNIRLFVESNLQGFLKAQAIEFVALDAHKKTHTIRWVRKKEEEPLIQKFLNADAP